MNKKEDSIGQDILKPLSFLSTESGTQRKEGENEPLLELREMRVRNTQQTILREDFERDFYDAQEKEAKMWVEEVLKDENEKSIDDFKELLKDGVIICRLLQSIDETVMTKFNNTPKTPANCMDNIELFIKGVKQLGIKVSFTSVDLYEQKNMKKVIACIHELGYLSNKKGELPEFKSPSTTFRNLINNEKKAKKIGGKYEEKYNNNNNNNNDKNNNIDDNNSNNDTKEDLDGDKQKGPTRASSWGDLTLRGSTMRRSMLTSHRSSGLSSNNNNGDENNSENNKSISHINSNGEIVELENKDQPQDSQTSPDNNNGGSNSEDGDNTPVPLSEVEELKLQLLREREAREALEKQLQEAIEEKERLESTMGRKKKRSEKNKRKSISSTSDFRNTKLSSSTSSLSRITPRSGDFAPSPSLDEQKQEKEKRKEERKLKEEARRAKLENKYQRQRLCILEEILNTEQDYVEDLRIIVKAQNGLIQDKVLNNQDMNLLFSNIQQILSVHEEIYKTLNLRITSTKSEECWNCSVGDIFTTLADFLKVYTTYVSNQTSQNQIADQNLHHNKSFVSSLLKNVPEFESKEVVGISFHSFLIKPIQRICKYPLLLRELDRSTPSEHQDKPNIEKALSQVQLIAQHINQKKKEMEILVKLMDIENSMTDLPRGFKIIATDRSLVREGNLIKISKGRAQERVFFLFTDIIVYAAKPLLKSNLLFKGKIPLDLMLINDLPDQSPDRKNIFELVRLDHKKKKYIICAKEPQDKIDWMKDIKSIVDQNLALSRQKTTQTPLTLLRELTEEIDLLKANPPVLGDDEDDTDYQKRLTDYESQLRSLDSKLADLKKDIFAHNTNDDLPPTEDLTIPPSS